MPNEFDKTLFEADFNNSDFAAGIDGMIASLKKAQASGEVTNATLEKMQGAIDAVTVSATELQKTTGKNIAGSLGDGSLVPKLSDIKTKVDEVSKTITSTVDKAKAKIEELKKTQDSYKDTIKATNESIKQNEKEIDSLTKKLNALNTSEKAGATAAKELKKEIEAIRAGNVQYGQQLTTLKKGLDDTTSAIKVQSKELKAAETAGNNFAGGISKVYSGLRTVANIVPGLGIGTLVGIIAGPAVDAFEAWFETMNKTNGALKLLKENQANINEVVAQADKIAGKQITDLKILYQTATDVNLPLKDRLNAVKALQKEFPDYFKNIEKENILNGQAKNAYDALSLSILATARATAAKSKLDELEAKQLDLDFEKQKVLIATTNELARARKAGATSITSSGGGIAGTGGTSIAVSAEENRRNQEKAINDRKALRFKQIEEDKKDLQAQEDFLVKFAGLNNIAKVIEATDNKKFKEKKHKEIVNIYEQELQKLKADIAKLDEKGFTNEASITKGIEEDFKKRSLAFEKAFKNKQLTASQLSSLNGYLKELQNLTLNQSLKSFREQRAAYLQAINDELTNVQLEESNKRIATLQDSFERERQTIIAETDKTISALEQKRDKQIADIVKNAAKNGLKVSEVQPQIDNIKTAYSKLIDDLGIIRNQKLQQLSFDTFEKLSEDANRLLSSGNLGVSEGSLSNIKAQTDLFLKGKISYEKYQKELTKIAEFETKERFRLEKLFLQAEIRIRQDKLASDRSLTSEQVKRLEDEIRRLQQQLADAEKGNATSSANTTNKNKNDRLQELVKYANAIGQVAQSVISFWQLANEAEQKALERSIAIQDRRVEAARNIAAKGNAEYLRLEEERQQALLIRQENAARRQLAINAAIQASQVLVALVSALAEGAKVGGALGAIIDVAAIVGAIASAYAIAQSFKPVTPSFFVGTEDTGNGGNADNKGGFAATLHPHERVLTAEENKKLKGISNKDLIRTVEQHRVMVQSWATARTPELNLAAMDMANHLTATQNIRLAGIMEDNNRELKENNRLQSQTQRLLKNMGFSVAMDRNGFVAIAAQGLSQIEKDKHA